MTLDRSKLAELLMERIYDVLWHDGIIDSETEEEYFKSSIRQDILIQLSIIEEELTKNA